MTNNWNTQKPRRVASKIMHNAALLIRREDQTVLDGLVRGDIAELCC
jgi:hypothetical protein